MTGVMESELAGEWKWGLEDSIPSSNQKLLSLSLHTGKIKDLLDQRIYQDQL